MLLSSVHLLEAKLQLLKIFTIISTNPSSQSLQHLAFEEPQILSASKQCCFELSL